VKLSEQSEYTTTQQSLARGAPRAESLSTLSHTHRPFRSCQSVSPPLPLPPPLLTSSHARPKSFDPGYSHRSLHSLAFKRGHPRASLRRSAIVWSFRHARSPFAHVRSTPTRERTRLQSATSSACSESCRGHSSPQQGTSREELTAARATCCAQSTMANQDMAALIAIYDSTNGPGWANKDGWDRTATSPCNFHGVECDDGDGRVTRLCAHRDDASATHAACARAHLLQRRARTHLLHRRTTTQ
jgi:hypothetical protein